MSKTHVRNRHPGPEPSVRTGTTYSRCGNPIPLSLTKLMVQGNDSITKAAYSDKLFQVDFFQISNDMFDFRP